VVYPKTFLRFDIVIIFNRKWMGYTRRELTSWLILIAQTAYFIENGLALTIGIFLLLSDYKSYYLMVYLACVLISTLARFLVFGIRFLKICFEYIRDDFFGVCCQNVDTALHDDV
jgi:hypothetical protein